jgi:hypothetical protein
MRIEYLNAKIQKNDTTCINMIRISRSGWLLQIMIDRMKL